MTAVHMQGQYLAGCCSFVAGLKNDTNWYRQRKHYISICRHLQPLHASVNKMICNLFLYFASADFTTQCPVLERFCRQ